MYTPERRMTATGTADIESTILKGLKILGINLLPVFPEIMSENVC